MKKEIIKNYLPQIIIASIIVLGLGVILLLGNQKRSDPMLEFNRLPINVISIAEKIGLDIEKFKTDLLSEEVTNRVQEDKDLGNKLMNNRGSTPSFFINEQAFIGQNSKTLQELVEALKKEVNRLLAENPDGKVNVIEFFDFNCIHCKNVNQFVDEMIEEFKDNENVQISKKVYPFLSSSSTSYAKAYIAAQNQEKGLEFTRELFSRL